MRHLHEPLTLPKHPELLEDILSMKIAIKLHQGAGSPKTQEEAAMLKDALNTHKMPTWDEVLDVLDKSYHAINEQRHDPRKY